MLADRRQKTIVFTSESYIHQLARFDTVARDFCLVSFAQFDLCLSVYLGGKLNTQSVYWIRMADDCCFPFGTLMLSKTDAAARVTV